MICGRQTLLPKSLAIPLCYNPNEAPQCHGGFADVWKGQHHGREVAAKAVRVYSTSDIERIRKAGRPRLVRINELTVPHTEVLRGGRDVELPSASERTAVGRGDDVRDSARDDIGMDVKREHQRVFEDGHQCRSFGACMSLNQGP